MATTAPTDPKEAQCCPSILQLIATYPRDRLFVHPLLWTARHLELLRCQFFDGGINTNASTEEEQSPNAGADSAPGDEWLQQYLAYINSDTRAAEFLATSGSTSSKQNALLRLLARMKHYRDQVDFRFGRRAVANLRFFVLCNPQSPSRPTPLTRLGYLNLHDMEDYRKVKLSGAQHRPNPPAIRRREKQLRVLTPDNPYEDPYIAGVLIALAQDQRVSEKGSSNESGNLHNAASVPPLQTLLANGPRDHEWLHIYTSKVSLEFLDRFDHPSRSPPASAQSQLGMVIHHRKLAFKPYKTLQQRLGSVIEDAILGKH